MKKFLVFIGITMFIFLTGCRKEKIEDENMLNLEEEAANSFSTEQFFTFNSSQLKVNLNKEEEVTYREDEFINDSNLIDKVRRALRDLDTQQPFIEEYTQKYGLPIWDKLLMFEAETQNNDMGSSQSIQNGHVILIPFAKIDSENTTAVLPIHWKNNEFSFQSIIPRFNIVQLEEALIEPSIISSVGIISKFDVSIFQHLDILYYIVSTLEMPGENVDDVNVDLRYNCWWAYIHITHSTEPISNGPFMWQPIYSTTTNWIWVCDDQGDFLGNHFNGLDPYDHYNPINPNGHFGSGIGIPSDYISGLEHYHAQEWHNIFMQHNPGYVHLNNIFNESMSQNWSFTRMIGIALISELMSSIIEDQAFLEGISQNDLINLLNDLPQTDLKDFVENAIEILADEGVRLSFTKAIKHLAEFAHQYENIISELSSLDNNDQNYLVWNRAAFSQIMNYVQEGNTIDDFSIIDNEVYVKDEDGILHVFVEPIDMTTSSKSEIVSQAIKVLNSINKYECTSDDYEGIDWRDYFDNMQTVSFSDANWQSPSGTICSISLNLDFDMQPRYTMETAPSWQGEISPIESYQYTWSRLNTNVPMLQITIPISCLQEFEDYTFNNC